MISVHHGSHCHHSLTGLWSGPFWSDEASDFKHDELFASDGLLLGRVTYEGFAKAWPTMEGTGDYGERMNSLPKYVASRTLDEAGWNATVIKGSVPEAVPELKQQPGQDLLVFGSGQLLHTLLQHHLVDEYRLMVHPIIAGSGKRLFPQGTAQTVLKLVAWIAARYWIAARCRFPSERFVPTGIFLLAAPPRAWVCRLPPPCWLSTRCWHVCERASCRKLPPTKTIVPDLSRRARAA